MAISDQVNSAFFAELFREKDLIVSVRLHTFDPGKESLYATIKTLIVVAPYIEKQAEQDQLGKILSACKMQQGAFTICEGNCSWAALRQYENIENILVFGLSENDLDINCKLIDNQIHEFDNRRWIKTFPLHRLLSDTTAKNVLWQQALKPLFIDI